MLRLFYLLLVFLVLLLTVGCKRTVVFEGTSMRPTIEHGDVLLMESGLDEIRRGDIVQFKYPQDPSKVFIKRVLGLPNERIEIREGVTFINGSVILEDYVLTDPNNPKTSFSASLLAKDAYFVMGDNRDNSLDSRYWGTVHKDLILSKWSGEKRKPSGN